MSLENNAELQQYTVKFFLFTLTPSTSKMIYYIYTMVDDDLSFINIFQENSPHLTSSRNSRNM